MLVKVALHKLAVAETKTNLFKFNFTETKTTFNEMQFLWLFISLYLAYLNGWSGVKYQFAVVSFSECIVLWLDCPSDTVEVISQYLQTMNLYVGEQGNWLWLNHGKAEWECVLGFSISSDFPSLTLGGIAGRQKWCTIWSSVLLAPAQEIQ